MLKKDLENHIYDLHAEIDEANERLSAIWELHEKVIDGDYCSHCMYNFPCPTRQAFFLCDCCDGSE